MIIFVYRYFRKISILFNYENLRLKRKRCLIEKNGSFQNKYVYSPREIFIKHEDESNDSEHTPRAQKWFDTLSATHVCNRYATLYYGSDMEM